MARLIRPLRQWPLLQHNHCCSHTAFRHILSPSLTLLLSPNRATSNSNSITFASAYLSNSSVHFRSRALRLADAPSPSDFEGGGESNSDSDSDVKRSRNQKKRQAKRAVQWGMELASFSAPQIKRILRMASLEREVYDALMLVKRLGPDVREGKRRQFNYIGKLLREVKPELMDALIHSTEDGDWSRLQAVSGLETEIIVDEDEEHEESEYDEDEEGLHEYVNVATRWLDGLVNKDVEITNEVYAVSSVDFDRQELRKLVRKVHAAQEQKNDIEENDQETETAILAAKKPLTRFLRALAKQMPTESIHNSL